MKISPPTTTILPQFRHHLQLLSMVQQLAALAPVFLLVWIYALAWRASTLLGYWAKPFENDPKFYIPADQLFDALYAASPLFNMWFTVSLIVFPLLTFGLVRHNTRTRTLILIVVYVGSIIILRVLPSTAIDWYFD